MDRNVGHPILISRLSHHRSPNHSSTRRLQPLHATILLQETALMSVLAGSVVSGDLINSELLNKPTGKHTLFPTGRSRPATWTLLLAFLANKEASQSLESMLECRKTSRQLSNSQQNTTYDS